MDIQLNYAVLGEGFPLVLLHGNGDDLTYFRNQMEPFARHFQVIALETRGPGGRAPSPWTGSPTTCGTFWTAGASGGATCWASPTGGTSPCSSP